MTTDLDWLYNIEGEKKEERASSAPNEDLDWLYNVGEKPSISPKLDPMEGPPPMPEGEVHFPEPPLSQRAVELAIQMGGGIEQAGRGVQDTVGGLLTFPVWLAGAASRYGEEFISPLYRRGNLDTSTPFPEYEPESIEPRKYKATDLEDLYEEAVARGDKWQAPFLSKGPIEPTIIEQVARDAGVPYDPYGPAKTYEAITGPVHKVMEHLPSKYIQEEIFPYNPHTGLWTGLGADFYILGKAHRGGKKAARKARKIGRFMRDHAPAMNASVKNFLKLAGETYGKDFKRIQNLLRRRVKEKKISPDAEVKEGILNEIRDLGPEYKKQLDQVEALKQAEREVFYRNYLDRVEGPIEDAGLRARSRQRTKEKSRSEIARRRKVTTGDKYDRLSREAEATSQAETEKLLDDFEQQKFVNQIEALKLAEEGRIGVDEYLSRLREASERRAPERPSTPPESAGSLEGPRKDIPEAAQRIIDTARSKPRRVWRKSPDEALQKIREAQEQAQVPDTRSTGPKKVPLAERISREYEVTNPKEVLETYNVLDRVRNEALKAGKTEYADNIYHLMRLLTEVGESPRRVWSEFTELRRAEIGGVSPNKKLQKSLDIIKKAQKEQKKRAAEAPVEPSPPREKTGVEADLENKLLSRLEEPLTTKSRPETGAEGESPGQVRVRDTEGKGLEAEAKTKAEEVAKNELDLNTASSEVKTLYNTAYEYALDEGFHDIIRENAGKTAQTIRRRVRRWAEKNEVALNEAKVDAAITAFNAKEGLGIKKVSRPELDYMNLKESISPEMRGRLQDLEGITEIPTIKLTKEQQKLFKEGKLKPKDLEKIAEEHIADTLAERVREHETVKAAYDLMEEFDWIAELKEERLPEGRRYDPAKEVAKAKAKSKELGLPKDYGSKSLKGDFADPKAYADWLLGEQRKEAIQRTKGKPGPVDYERLYETGGADAVADAFLKHELIYIPGVSEFLAKIQQSKRAKRPNWVESDVEVFAAIKEKSSELGISAEEVLRTVMTMTLEEKRQLLKDFKDWDLWANVKKSPKRTDFKHPERNIEENRGEIRGATDELVELAKEDPSFSGFVDKLIENRVITEGYEKGSSKPIKRALTLRDDTPVKYVQPKREPFKIWSPHIFWRAYTDYRSNPAVHAAIAQSIYDFNVVELEKWTKDLKKEIPSAREALINDMRPTYEKLGKLRKKKDSLEAELKSANREVSSQQHLTQRRKEYGDRVKELKKEIEANEQAARELLLPEVERLLPKWIEEHPSVRVHAWIAERIKDDKLSPRELELAKNIKQYLNDTREDMLSLGLATRGTDYVPAVLVDVRKFMEGNRFMDMLRPGQEKINYMLKLQRKATDSLLFPDIITALDTYIPMIERKLAYEPVFQRFGPEFVRQLSPKAREYFNEWQEANFFRRPATIMDRAVDAVVNFEYLQLIALSTSVAFKHLLKLGGTGAQHSWTKTLPEALMRSAKIPVQAMMEKFGIKGKHNELRLYRSFVRSGELVRALDEMQLNNRTVMHFVRKWSATPVRIIEAVDNGVNVMAGAIAATHKGMTWKDTYRAIWESILDVNFRGGVDQPLWQKGQGRGSLIRALTMFQMTPWKLLEFKKNLVQDLIAGRKDAFGTYNGMKLLRYLVLIGATEYIARANNTSLLAMWAHLPFFHGAIKGDSVHVPEFAPSPIITGMVDMGWGGKPKTPLAKKWFKDSQHGNVLIGLANMTTDWPSLRRIYRTTMQKEHSRYYDSWQKELVGLKNWKAIEGKLYQSRSRLKRGSRRGNRGYSGRY